MSTYPEIWSKRPSVKESFEAVEGHLAKAESLHGRLIEMGDSGPEAAILQDKFDAEIRAAEAAKETLDRAADLEDQHRKAAKANYEKRKKMTIQPNHVAPKLKAFKGETAHRDAYDAGMFLRALSDRSKGNTDSLACQHVESSGWGIYMTQTEGDGTKGGYVTPAPLAATVLDVLSDVGVAQNTARIFNTESNSLDVPKKTGGPTVYLPGEATEITESTQTFGQVPCTLKKRAVLHKLSNELVSDAIISIVDDVTMRVAHDLAEQQDDDYCNGDGTSTYGGEEGLLNLLNATTGVYTAPTNSDTWGELTIADFTGTMAKLPSKYHSNASWICSANFYVGVMLKVLAEAGGNTVMNLEQGANRGMFLGKMVYLTDKMPTATAASTVSCLFGSFSDSAILCQKAQGVQFSTSDAAYFAEDCIGLRATYRYDIAVHEGGTDSVAGGYVGLSTNS